MQKHKRNYKPLEKIPPVRRLAFPPHRHSCLRPASPVCKLGKKLGLASKAPSKPTHTLEDEP